MESTSTNACLCGTISNIFVFMKFDKKLPPRVPAGLHPGPRRAAPARSVRSEPAQASNFFTLCSLCINGTHSTQHSFGTDNRTHPLSPPNATSAMTPYVNTFDDQRSRLAPAPPPPLCVEAQATPTSPDSRCPSPLPAPWHRAQVHPTALVANKTSRSSALH